MMHRSAVRMLGAGALAILACSAALAQDPPPAVPLAHPHTHHMRHRHHARHTHRPPPVTAAAPAPQIDAGTTPAPVPNEDAGPPGTAQDPRPSFNPGSLQIHYPPLGDGYLPGSSPQDMANQQTPSVPGATVKMPLRQTPPPQPLPLPGQATGQGQ